MAGVIAVGERLPPLLALALAVLLVACETAVVVGLLLPVEITLMFTGFLAYLGELPLLAVTLVMVGAAMLGDTLALRSGRRYGPRVRASRWAARVGAHRWDRAERILRRLGGRSALVARWVPFVRTLLPRLAGAAGVSYRHYLSWNLLAVVTAVGSSVLLGYLAGASYQQVAQRFGQVVTGLLVVLVGGGLGWLLISRPLRRWWRDWRLRRGPDDPAAVDLD